MTAMKSLVQRAPVAPAQVRKKNDEGARAAAARAVDVGGRGKEEGGAEAPIVGAYGCTFVLAPAWSMRLDPEESLLLPVFAQHAGLALMMHTELQSRRSYDDFHLDVAPALAEDARRVFEEENAGGSSLISESMSMEVLARTFGAKLLKTEMQLSYFPSNSAMTDFSIELDGIELGVSVTRALSHPSAPLELEDALKLLRKKLSGVLKSTAACYNASWSKQILHIWARTLRVARVIEEAYMQLEPDLIADTLVLVTRCSSLPELFTETATARPPQPPKLKGAKDAAHLRALQESDPKEYAEGYPYVMCNRHKTKPVEEATSDERRAMQMRATGVQHCE
eukprot:CAMPEP_0181248598 /NCGR_PEP_ID=MMETSP1096-20121128/45254_1 /TAXON_ID=156174 ORGANISM="Chrysochromulina ericina, Strain CCMP281" /NCGR_SAMPLE_ID=MMETSP1096 /ASSEMBLY_ACC=CAM_ASM_000453 /LENGTH=337 /DNA_ID=CAMNT_0023345775 /DNA_START=84 /DNA_END=1098 /DNA_ORIENTATION=+